MTKQAPLTEPRNEDRGGYKVRYRHKWEGAEWAMLSDTYDTFPSACMIATALENRGYLTEVVNEDFDYQPL